MKFTLVLLSLVFSMPSLADSPKPVVEYASASNGYASISGRLESTTSETIGVTVKIGGLSYSTIADPNGKWGLVVKHRSSSYDVESFSLLNSLDRSTPQSFTIK